MGMHLQAPARPTPASSMVQCWAPAIASPPGAAARAAEEARLRAKAKTARHRNEMDRHVEEKLEKQFLQRHSIRHSLSSSSIYHNTWQGRFEEAIREAGWAMSQIIGCCSGAVAVRPAADAPCPCP